MAHDTTPGRDLPVDPPPKLPGRPRTRAPGGTTDCHFHIFGPKDKYPLSPDRFYDPADASVDSYLQMAAIVGIERMVVVNGSPYRTDNRCILDAIAAFGRHRAKGVAVISPDITDAELQALADGGICGIRINAINGGTPLSDLPAIARRIKPLGMHLQLWVESDNHAGVAKILGDIDMPVVIDHMGQIPTSYGVDHPHFRTLIAMLETGRVWIKLIGYRISDGPPYGDLTAPVKEILSVAEDRCVWGTDWPHPTLRGRPMPDDGAMLDLLASWCSPKQLQKILVDNPARLYGF